MMSATLLAAVAGLSLTLVGSASSRRLSAMPDDAALLARFEDAVSVDIACAQYAVEHAHSKEVRDFAGVLVREHGMAKQMARDVAAQMRITLKPLADSPRRAEHEKMLKALKERPDVAFDVLFMRHEIEYHREIVDLFKKEWMPGTQNADLSAFLSQVAPAFEAHSAMAEELGKKLTARP